MSYKYDLNHANAIPLMPTLFCQPHLVYRIWNIFWHSYRYKYWLCCTPQL